MARLNTRINSTPVRDQTTPLPGSTARTQRSESSDKENQPAERVRDKGKGRMGPPPGKLPTPNSDTVPDPNSAKRRRVGESPMACMNGARTQDSGAVDYQGQKYYDPTQDQNERQEVKRKSRALERDFNENRDVYLKADSGGLQQTINRANSIFEGVKQTSDATLDSRLMVSVSDLAYKKSAQLVLGDNATGVDVDEFVSKCIAFMRSEGNHAGSTQRRRQRNEEDDDEDEESGDMLDWARLGARACFPHNLRPPISGFLLGPLSVQKRVRTQTQRRARQRREEGGKEVRPEAITKDDLGQAENNTLTTICAKIKDRLSYHIRQAERKIQAMGDLDDDQMAAAMKKYRITPIGGPSLFDFVINPHSFGQTVENIFYVSFLIKEGVIGVGMDQDGLPALLPSTPHTLSEQREKGSTKHQAVFSIDYATWQSLIDAFDIKESLIEHRSEQQATQLGTRGWYN